jgi:hypothetical protein
MAMTKRGKIIAQHQKHLLATQLLVEETGYKFKDEDKPKAKTKEKKLSTKAQKVQDLINKDTFECQNENVAELMSIILEEDIKPCWASDNSDLDDDDYYERNPYPNSFMAQGIVYSKSNKSPDFSGALIFDLTENKVLVVHGQDWYSNFWYFYTEVDETPGWASRPATQEEVQEFLNKTYGKIPVERKPTKKKVVKS